MKYLHIYFTNIKGDVLGKSNLCVIYQILIRNGRMTLIILASIRITIYWSIPRHYWHSFYYRGKKNHSINQISILNSCPKSYVNWTKKSRTSSQHSLINLQIHPINFHRRVPAVSHPSAPEPRAARAPESKSLVGV